MKKELKILVGATRGPLYEQAAKAFAALRFEVAPSSTSNPDAFAEAVLETKPDVVLLDVAMPKLSGMRLLKRLRRQTPGTHVILFCKTASVFREKRELLKEADDVVVRPFPSDELLFRVEKMFPLSEETVRVASVAENMIIAQRTAKRPLVSELHDPESGRLDAKKIADYLGLRLSALSTALGKSYKAVFKTPASESLQSALAPMHRVVIALHRYFGAREESLAWLNTANEEFGGKRPKDLLLEGRAEVVADGLEGALAGVTS